jgi:hypothetical protein
METSGIRAKQMRAVVKPKAKEGSPPDLGRGEDLITGFI